MRVPEPLRNSPFHMYRRRSLYTGLYGSEPSGSIQPPGNAAGGYGVRSCSSPDPLLETYMSGFPHEYAPHPGPIQMPRKDYIPHDPFMVGGVTRSVQSTIPDELPMTAMPLEEIEGMDLDEPYAHLSDDGFNRSTLTPSDSAEAAHEFMRVRGGQEASEFDSELRAQMREIQMAVKQTQAGVDPELRDCGLTMPRDFFEQQKQVLESQFREWDADQFDYGAEMEALFHAQEALFNPLLPDTASMDHIIPGQPVEEMGPLAFPVGESLEQLIEAHEMRDNMADALDYDDSVMAPDAFEQEMEPMEPHPDPFEPYGGMMPQEMYDEQMPGVMHPYMMPGLFGPGPMLDPGPGGPP